MQPFTGMSQRNEKDKGVTQKQRLPSKTGALGVIASEAKQSHPPIHSRLLRPPMNRGPRNDIGRWQHELGPESLFWGSKMKKGC